MERLYTINSETAAQLGQLDVSPVLLYALDGFVDSGIAAGLAIGDLVNQGESRPLVSFNTDELVDYRSRRPPMTYSEEGWSGFRRPWLGIDLMHDADGSPFLLMYGPEPDMRWDAFTDAVIEVVETFDVRLAVGMHGMPTAAPHTRDWKVTGPGNAGELVRQVAGSPGAELQMPGSAMALTEHKLREVGREVQTFIVHVPHYLTQMPSPIATARLMEEVGAATGLRLDLSRLVSGATAQREQIDRQIGEQPELAEAIKKMEEEYDRSQSGATGGELPAQALPTGEELAAEFERYLAGQNRDDQAWPFTD
ncbi:MAG: PAC2 family protein [Bifidobacteriaceae bacterium]|jgi:predicted ATP-grasp superfamily ATP-dependent carboligase|nr:PAC2 family protein [Bifidobacteriaceae bacterium]